MSEHRKWREVSTHAIGDAVTDAVIPRHVLVAEHSAAIDEIEALKRQVVELAEQRDHHARQRMIETNDLQGRLSLIERAARAAREHLRQLPTQAAGEIADALQRALGEITEEDRKT